MDFSFSNYKPSKKYYKDSTSTNFLSLNFGFANIMDVPKKERVTFLNKEMGLKPVEISDSYEIYKNDFMDSTLQINGLHCHLSKFISLKDSVEVTVSYETFDRNKNKLNDYNKIVEQITEELKKGSQFQTKEKKLNNRIIAN